MVIAKGEKPVVRLVPIPQGKFRFGVLEPGALGDGPDFLAPLDEEELAAWEGELLTSLLLDTHVWAWSLTNDRRISDRARREIVDADAIYVSAISFFEIAQKVRRENGPKWRRTWIDCPNSWKASAQSRRRSRRRTACRRAPWIGRIAIHSINSWRRPRCAAAFCGILAAGAAVALLAPSSTPASLHDDARGQRRQGLPARPRDRARAEGDPGMSRRSGASRSTTARPARLSRNGSVRTAQSPPTSQFSPDQPFNIIYSSGTTGAPKGIVQPHRMRWTQFTRVSYSDAVTIVSTPLYSNTTLVVFIPTLAHGGTAVLMAKFDAGQFLRISQERRVTHAMLVPVQYRRIMDASGFRPIRSLELRPEALDQRAVPRRAEGRRAEAMAGGPCRVLRDDRRRRVDDARRPSVSAQAAHRRPADAGT